jgi:hypothetical protein
MKWILLSSTAALLLATGAAHAEANALGCFAPEVCASAWSVLPDVVFGWLQEHKSIIVIHARPHARRAQETPLPSASPRRHDRAARSVPWACFRWALIISKRLTEQQALRRDLLTREAENILAEFTRRWLQMKGSPHQL